MQSELQLQSQAKLGFIPNPATAEQYNPAKVYFTSLGFSFLIHKRVWVMSPSWVGEI
jgi:hypothetical protein